MATMKTAEQREQKNEQERSRYAEFSQEKKDKKNERARLRRQNMTSAQKELVRITGIQQRQSAPPEKKRNQYDQANQRRREKYANRTEEQKSEQAITNKRIKDSLSQETIQRRKIATKAYRDGLPVDEKLIIKERAKGRITIKTKLDKNLKQQKKYQNRTEEQKSRDTELRKLRYANRTEAKKMLDCQRSKERFLGKKTDEIEAILARDKLWRTNNQDKRRITCITRRSRLAGNGGRPSKNIISELTTKQKGRCRICSVRLGAKYHIDHIIPIARGGTSYDNNLQLLCPKCNMSKNAKDPYEYAQRLGKLFL